MRHFPSIYAVITLLLYIIPRMEAQDLKFEHLTVEDGLSNNFISSIAQDSSGFMWFATEDGLNKYDGYDFTVYRHDPNDSTSLSENNIKVLQVDKNGILWIGTNGGGLNAFNPQTEEFTRYNMDPDYPNAPSKKQIYDMYLDKKGYLWINVGGKGLYCIDPGTNKINHYTYNQDDPNTISTNAGLTITSTVENGKEILWVGSWGGGLNKFDPEENTWTHFWHDHNNPNSLSSNFLAKIYGDNAGILWITTGQDGLDKLDTKTGRFTNYRNDPENPNSIVGNIIGEVRERDGILWIATMKGLNSLNIKKEKFISYFNNPADPTSIGQNSNWRIYESKGEILWIGGWSGLDIIDFEQKPFGTYQQQPGNPNSLPDNFVCAILETQEHEGKVLWIGTKDGGLNKINRSSGQLTNYRHDPSDPNSLSDNFVFSIAQSSYEGKRELWLGTIDGLNRFDLQTGIFTHYHHDPADTTSLSEDYVHKVYAGKDGSIWVGTRNRGLCRFDPKTNKFKRYYHNSSAIWVIYEDTSGFLWHGSTFYGLIKLDPVTDEVTYYKHNNQDQSSITSNTIRSIHESFFNGKHVLWIGTNAGLNRYDYETEIFHRTTRKDGLPSDEVNGILEDNKGNLWLATGDGLSKLNPVSGAIRNYDKDDGLPGNQFVRGGYFQGENGEMFFGSTNGLTSFFPDQIKDNSHSPEIVLTDFQLFNKSVPVKNDSLADGENYFLPKHISALSQIELSYNQSVFSFEFAALDYRKPQKNRYAYIMEGVDPDWVYTDASRRFATYTNLDPGEYVFRVKGSNNDGLWNEAGTSIKVIITPPWWETQLAYIFYFLFFITFIVGIWRFQTNRLKMRQQLQMKQFEAEKLHEVDNLKSRFFANISHEFRTPLTLIKGPLKQLMGGEFAGNIKETYKMMLRNSDRLLGLINQILDLSKLESGEMKLKVAETDIVKFIKGMVLSFSPLAETKKVTLKFSSPENSIIGYIDRDKVEKTVTNLLSNAFKFTPEGGEVKVTLSSVIPAKAGIQNVRWIPNQVQGYNPAGIRKKNWIPDQVRDDKNGRGKSNGSNSRYPHTRHPLPVTSHDFIEITVSNTGPGIPSDQLDKIFDRFYQADDNYKKDGEGTGIGLALTKELVEACHGDISVRSIPGKSTTFRVELPINRESFKEDEIVTTLSPLPQRVRDRLLVRRDTWGVLGKKEEVFPAVQKSLQNKSAPILLIVEDNPDVTNYISSFMANDYRILTAENGKKGLKKTIDKYPDLVISDVMMPEMDGFELCKNIKSDERISHIPVILLTAKADLDSKIEGLKFGADDYVTKPFEARELQIRARNLINQRQKLREKFSALIDLNPADISASSMDEQLLQRLLAVFEEHIEEPDFNLEHLSNEIGMSRTHLNRKIQALTNLSAREFIRTLRLQHAAGLLRSASGTVSEIAYKVGFNNLSYFSKAFRKHFGRLPSDFAKKQ